MEWSLVQGPQSQTVYFDFRFMKLRRMIFCIFRLFSENLVLHNFNQTICEILIQFLHCRKTWWFENSAFSAKISILWQNCKVWYYDFWTLFFIKMSLRNNQWLNKTVKLMNTNEFLRYFCNFALIWRSDLYIIHNLLMQPKSISFQKLRCKESIHWILSSFIEIVLDSSFRKWSENAKYHNSSPHKLQTKIYSLWLGTL